MSNFSFFAESPLTPWSNVCVVGQDGKGWTSETLLSCVSPWLRDLLATLPRHSDHCIILPDIPWEQISELFKIALDVSGDLAKLLNTPHGDAEQTSDIFEKSEHLDKQELLIETLEEVQDIGETKQNILSNDSTKAIKFSEKSSNDFGKKVKSSNCKKKEVDKKYSNDFLKQKELPKGSSTDSSYNHPLIDYIKQEGINQEISKNLEKASNEGKKQEKSSVTTRTLRIRKGSKQKKYRSTCGECDILFSSKHELNKHNKISGHTKYSEKYLFKLIKSTKLNSYSVEQIKILGIFPCDECDKKCVSQSSLEKHKGILHPVLNSCNHCEFTINSGDGLGKLRAHIRSTHANIPKPFSCDICDKRFKESRKIYDHKKAEHEGIRFPCTQCDYKAKTSGSLKQHFESIHEKLTISCDTCGKVYSNQSNLHQHKKSVHEGIFYLCDQCDYKGTQKRNLQSHIEKVHEGIFYPCNQCDYKGPHKRKLRIHIKNRHSST